MNKAYLLIAGAMLLAPAANAQIADGSFETKGNAGTVQNGGTPVTGYCYDGGNYGDGQCTAGSDWNGSGVVKSGNAPWGGTLAADGSYFAFIQNDQALSQSFTVGKSGLYNLTWMDANRSNWGGTQSYSIEITGGPSSLAFGTLGTPYTDWTARSSGVFALAKNTAYTLTFTGQTPSVGGNDSTSFIDKVALTHVTQGAVPEPATWALMLGGFGFAGGMLRRRAGKSALRHA